MPVWCLWTASCDVCSWWEDDTVGDTAADAREAARRLGWYVSGRRVLCRKCRQKEGL